MTVFNSLGSNYSVADIWRNILPKSDKSAKQALAEQLSKHYGGLVTLTYKGREALEIALKQAGLPPGSAIGINGYTCYAVYKAVANTGYKAEPIDVASAQLNFGVSELKTAHSRQPRLKAIIVQNTLGFPADMAGLSEYCRNNGILIIEDLAHSTGAEYSDRQEVGTVGDFTMMSFSQDKPLDVVAGGALIDRRRIKAKAIDDLPDIGAGQQLKNRLYPFWTGLIRITYPIGMGRFVHYGLKKLNLMATPMSDDLEGLHAMSSKTAGLILTKWLNRTTEFDHRRAIASVYDQQLPPNLKVLKEVRGRAAYLRYPIVTESRQALLNYLRQNKIFIGDTWYDAPIGPLKYLAQTDYQTGSCPKAEELSAHMVNLPTHRHITPEVTAAICAKIKQWQVLQQKL